MSDQHLGTTTHTLTVMGNGLPGSVGDNGIQPGITYWYELVAATSNGMLVDNNGGKCYSVTIPGSGGTAAGNSAPAPASPYAGTPASSSAPSAPTTSPSSPYAPPMSSPSSGAPSNPYPYP